MSQTNSQQSGQDTRQDTDILVIGAGMVGAAAALGLSQQGYRVTVVEPQFVRELDANAGYDLRISAVTTDNIELLKRLGAWSYIEALRKHPFTELAVRREGDEWLVIGEGRNTLLGYMLENTVIQHGLYLAMQAHPNIRLLETQLTQLNSEQGQAELASEEHIRFSWVIGCDGAQSQVRQASGIGVAGKNYGQSCLLSVVQCDQAVGQRTWESFSHNGEIHALLPLEGNQACLIAYGQRHQVTAWEASSQTLQQVLTQRFAQHVGAFQLVKSGSFPLTRQTALHYVKHRTILLGDAAHTIHPMAGQGVNLGFRDVKQLLQSCEGLAMQDPAQRSKVERALRQYTVLRRLDNETMAQAMDTIDWAFKQHTGPVSMLRNIVVSSLQRITPARQILSAYASGVWKLER